MTLPTHKVSYIHGAGYRVSRTFDSKALAQEFIDNNALVFPLPGVRLEVLTTECGSVWDFPPCTTPQAHENGCCDCDTES
jgi:hypothetical protein